MELCSDEDSDCSFATPSEAVELYEACVAADVPIPEEELRVEAYITPEDPTNWLDADAEPASEEIEGFEAADCSFEDFGDDAPDIMTCGVDLSLQAFTCLLPTDELPALLGSPSIPAPTASPPAPAGSCPLADEDPNWVYLDEDSCIL